jgi:hypothetical protein
MYNILSIGRASVFVMPCFRAHVCLWMEGRKDSTKLQHRSDQSPVLADIDDPQG